MKSHGFDLPKVGKGQSALKAFAVDRLAAHHFGDYVPMKELKAARSIRRKMLKAGTWRAA